MGLDLGLDENERRGVPHYESVTYTNPGPKDLPTDQAGDVYLVTEGGRKIGGKTPFVLDAKIPGCPSDWVARMIRPGAPPSRCARTMPGHAASSRQRVTVYLPTRSPHWFWLCCGRV
ncbi:hypothetical protein ABZ401_26040, partial [Streptomyces sp. NPDC005892]|uniref:hypothetical protein n=1 Tax=Streptomyces sp. NPDC005892 TaxID=3155593 RepID=UPI0033F49B7B